MRPFLPNHFHRATKRFGGQLDNPLKSTCLVLPGHASLLPCEPFRFPDGAPIAQLDRASDYGSEGFRFDS